MPSQVPDFPMPIRMVYQPDGSAKSSFLADVASMATDAKRQFETSFRDIGAIVERSLSGLRGGQFNFAVDLSGLRQTASSADFAVQRLSAMRDAAVRLAASTGDTSRSTQQYISALRAQVTEAEQAKRAADGQVLTYSRLQAEIDKTVASNRRLADSYRATFAEQARAENFTSRYQAGINRVFAPGLDRQAKSARDSASVFEQFGYAPKVDLREGAQSILAGKAAIDAAAVSATTLDQVLGRVASKGQAVSQALEAAGRKSSAAAEEQARTMAQAAAQADRYAAEANRLRAALDPLEAAHQRLDAELAQADRLLAAGAINMNTYGQAVNRAADNFQNWEVITRRGTDAHQNVINSTRALRQATLQAGQQVQDLGISLYSGQNASVVFAQQLPQLAFALSGLEGSANKAHDRIGRFATFLSGPWGLAVGLGVGVVVQLVSSLVSMGDEAEKASNRTFDFTKNLDLMKLKAGDAATAMRQLAEETRNAILEQGTFFSQRAGVADKSVEDLTKKVAAQRAEVDRLTTQAQAAGAFSANPIAAARAATQLYELSRAKTALTELQKALKDAKEAAANADIANVQRTVINSMDASAAATDKYTEALGKLNARRRESAKLDDSLKNAQPNYAAAARRNAPGYISEAGFQAEFARIRAERDAAIKAARDAERNSGRVLTNFISPVSGATVTGRFGEQRGGRQHAGVDLAVPVGTPVKAPAGGVIIEAGRLGNYGNVVFIDHGGGTISRLAHLSKIGATEGQIVTQGQVIGLSGGARGAPGAGNSRGPHLHQETIVNGRPVNPLTGRFATDEAKAEQIAQRTQKRIQRAQEELQEFGERSAESIARLNERFNEQPRLIDQAAQATRQLDAIMADLSARKPVGFEQMIADAQRAKAVVQDALVRPFRDMERDSERRMQTQVLIAQGRDTEAEALQRIWQMEDKLLNVSEERKRQVYDLVKAEDKLTETLRRQEEQRQSYLDATRSIRQEVEAIFAGEGSFKNFGQIFKRLNAQVITEQMFGGIFRDLDQWVKSNTGLGRANSEFTEATKRGADAALNFANALTTATSQIKTAGAGPARAFSPAAANDNASLLSAGALSIGSVIARAAGLSGPRISTTAADGGGANDEIVVVAPRPDRDTVAGMSPEIFMSELSTRFGTVVGGKLDDIFGTQFFGRLSGVIGGAFYGNAVGGIPGAALGAIGGIPGLPKGIAKGIGGALGGMQTGSLIAGLGDALGLKMSNTGSQIGGAIGSFLPIPGGDIIGAIAGGIIGKLIGGTKRGSATIGGTGGNLSITGTGGNSSSFIKTASGAGDSVIASVERIADALGASVNASLGSVSIGLRDGKYRVDTSGKGITKTSKGAIDFGKDGAEAAARAAALDLIQDGVIVGLRAGTQKLLKEGKDLEKGLKDALDFESIFSRLKTSKDPVGAALDTLDKEFTRLRALAVQAGEGMVELEELYGRARAEAIKQAREQVTGALQGLLNGLDPAGSLVSRRDSALAAFNPLRARVAANDSTAYEDFADAANKLLDAEKALAESRAELTDVSQRLKVFRDPLGAAVDSVDQEFARLRRSFDSAGASAAQYAELEELYGRERAKVIDDTQRSLTGSLRALRDELTIGASGLSLRDRKAAALAAYNPLAARASAGDSTAFEDFGTAARALLEIERQISGSQSPYFDVLNGIKGITDSVLNGQAAVPGSTLADAVARFSDGQEAYTAILTDIRDLTKASLERENALIDAITNRDSPFTQSVIPTNDNSAVVGAIDSQTQAIVAALEAQGVANAQNMAALAAAIQASGGFDGAAAISFNGYY